MKGNKRLGWTLFALYCLFIVWTAILKRTPTGKHKMELTLLWSYREMLTGDPNWKKDVVQNLQNIVFFIPFGILHPKKKWKIVLMSGIVFSALIEICQYVFGLGLCELDDVICNTLGAMIGFWMYLGLMKLVGENR